MSKQFVVVAELIRRLLNVACAAAGLVVLLPLFAALSVAISLDSGLPVFFCQTRVGKNGQPFRIVKFRTMHTGSPGALITAAGDGRVTRVGAVLRKHKLDELPQLFNVLTGDMSLVGPRPEVPEYVDLSSPVWRRVLEARPGITDLATLIYRDEEQILGNSADPNVLYQENILPAKLALNVGYLRSRSARRDFKLVLLTVYYSLFPAKFDPKIIEETCSAGHING